MIVSKSRKWASVTGDLHANCKYVAFTFYYDQYKMMYSKTIYSKSLILDNKGIRLSSRV